MKKVIHYKIFDGVACQCDHFFPILETRNKSKVTCKICRHAKWYLEKAYPDGIIRLPLGAQSIEEEFNGRKESNFRKIIFI